MSIVLRILRRATVRVGMAIARRRWTIAATSLAIAALIAGSALNLISLPTYDPGSASGAELTRAQDEPEATALYFQGHNTFNANLVWSAYSEPFARALIRAGDSPDRMQDQLAAIRDRGERLEPHFVAIYPTRNGKMAFYAVTKVGSGRGNVQTVPYTFVLDAEGKIAGVY